MRPAREPIGSVPRGPTIKPSPRPSHPGRSDTPCGRFRCLEYSRQRGRLFYVPDIQVGKIRTRGTLYGRCTTRTPEGQTWGRFSQKMGKKGRKWQPTKTHENARKPHKTRLFTRSRVLFAFAVYIHFEYGKRPYFCGLHGSEGQTRGKRAKQKTGRGDPPTGPLLNYEGDGFPPRYYYNMRSGSSSSKKS